MLLIQNNLKIDLQTWLLVEYIYIYIYMYIYIYIYTYTYIYIARAKT